LQSSCNVRCLIVAAAVAAVAAARLARVMVD